MIIDMLKTGIFCKDYRRQLWVTMSVTLITYCHGIGLGWLSPMLPLLQTEGKSPLDFVIDVHEASWLGAVISMGAITGNFTYSYIMNRFGRKVALYCLAVPNVCIWIFIYFAQSVEWLYLARAANGIGGGGLFIVLPLFIGEISDKSVRGRLSSFFNLTINMGILTGFVISSYVPYYLIPCIAIALPFLYIFLSTRFPETPQQLIRWEREEAAEWSLKYYRNCDGSAASKESLSEFQKQYDEMRQAIQQQMKDEGKEKLTMADFCNKRAAKAILTGLVLMVGNIFTGTFAFINYMSNIFATVRTQLDPNTNTIIIGAVQIVGTLTSIYLVDRYGRKILLIVSFAGSALGTAAFGVYAFYAEETDEDLSAYAAWLPVSMMAFIIFLANVGVISVTMVVLVEVLPQRIRAVATSACLACLSSFSFTSLKTFPLMMFYFGLAATMWFCSAVSALCLFYVSIFVEETKGKSIYE